MEGVEETPSHTCQFSWLLQTSTHWDTHQNYKLLYTNTTSVQCSLSAEPCIFGELGMGDLSTM